ncbi:glycoside hydrolase family 2 TIM barrel-domain containing protein [uncultured Winogradskyella sp.]|uniref:glycoside hydrolase family 2 TIM barrel-domain containing protein n=1 Tax=uncultured Winogradskyella sp. TaxID=395353 RepID=UPI00260CD905|nr:glycoside hydrolase family 2 TIM barrel-domain containing protein [uncultured Winogradskyella sp.]
MKKLILGLFTILISTSIFAQAAKVSVVSDENGDRLVVDGKDFMINGMNWDYVPRGTNVIDAEFYKKSDDIIKAGLDAEMLLLQNMNVNVIRQYTGVPAKWVRYIYENYGVYTMLNDSFGRYGLTIDGVWTPITDYKDPRTIELLMSEITKMVTDYKNTPGILMYLIGNENNYGLFWQGAETEDFPEGDEKKRAVGELRGRPMYKLMNEAAKAMKAIDPNHPVAICNGDTLFLDIVADECPDVDIYGTNMYRGESFTGAFEEVKKVYGKPIMFTEFGSDAYNAIENAEDQRMQAYYMVSNWKEIYENAAGLGKAQNSLGGFTFQFSDGWWKAGFDDRKDADTQQTESTWNAGGYKIDEAFPGANNMNEEWFGICAKGPTNTRGLYTLYPRAAYYALKEAHALNPYEEGVSLEFVQNYFKNINLMDAVLKARGDKAALGAGDSQKLSISRLGARFTTFSTGGNLLTTPDSPDPTATSFPNQLGFDHMQSYFVGIQGKPAPNMKANVDFNIVGNVAQNPIDEIFYENRARPVTVEGANGEEIVLNDNNRVQVYSAEFEWNAKEFDLRGFYRTGHYHWGYEGDFFGLYPEANYGPNLDIYGGEILGAEIDGKGAFKGLKAAIGPQLWWGANPTMLFKYHKEFKGFDITGIYHRDFETDIQIDPTTGQRVLDANQVRSGIIPAFPTERATLAIEREFGKFDVMIGGIWAGSPLNDLTFQDVRGTPGNYVVYEDRIQSSDNWGGKFKVMYQGGKFNWYGQAAYMGLVANGGADQTQTFTGWRLKDSGSGNQVNVLSGFTYTVGDFQLAPNFMYQKPLVDPMPNDVQGPGRLRNIIDDPFAVRNGNRETYGYEMLVTYDPTPGTWMYEWNNDRAEDAKFAANLGFTYRRLPTTTDAHIGFLANRQFFAFPQSAPAEDLWEINSRMVSKLDNDLGIIGNFYYGNGQANGDSDRLIKRFGGDIRAIYKKNMLQTHVKVNDWGPFDYHRDFNLTFPLQLMVDLSTSIGKPDWFILPSTRIGIRGTWRSLNEFSPRYSPLATPANTFNAPPIISPVGFGNGQEWEIRTYVHINIGK